MALKRKSKIAVEFSMASMTDMVFLLLIFFMLTSTVVVPNAIKVVLPQSSKQTAAKPLARVTIDAGLRYYVAFGNQTDRRVPFDDITPFLKECFTREPDSYMAIYADESVAYREVMRVVEIANRNNFKMLLMTRPK